MDDARHRRHPVPENLENPILENPILEKPILEKPMKTYLIALVLGASSMLAQAPAQEPARETAKDQAEIALHAAGCGPSAISFEVTADKNQHPLAQPEAGKALVYVINWVAVTTRVGIDGSWVGANRYRSYSSFSVEPGDHRVCLNAQGENLRGSALSMKVAAGQSLYLFVSPREEGSRWKLEEIDPARGLFLIASSSLSTAHAKK
jgi:hypothetical protein